MKKKIIVANWKMNHTLESANFFIKKLLETNILNIIENRIKIIIAVPSPFLYTLKKKCKDTQLKICAQNVYHENNGAYTGKISVDILTSIGIKNIMIGHSECRTYNNENNNILIKKLNLSLNNNFNVIFCLGESLKNRKENKYLYIIKNQIKDVVFSIFPKNIKNITIAYEPIWSIGSGLSANIEQIEKIHKYIRFVFLKKYGENIANNLKILYGGSVNYNNIKLIIHHNDIDGVLIGNSSLNINNFIKLLNEIK